MIFARSFNVFHSFAKHRKSVNFISYHYIFSPQNVHCCWRQKRTFFLTSRVFFERSPLRSQFSKSHLTRLIGLAKPEKWKLIGAMCLLIVSSTITMSVPFIIGRLIDVTYQQHQETARNNLLAICLALGVVFVIGALANCGRIYIMTSAAARVTQRLRVGVFSAILGRDAAFFDCTRTGELVNRLTSDTAVVGHSLTSNVSDGLRSLAMASGGVVMMCYVSPKLALFGLCVVPPMAGMAIVFGRYMKTIAKSVQDSLAAANAVAEERIAGVRTVRTFAREQYEVSSYTTLANSVLALCYRDATARAVFFSLNGLSGNAVIVGGLYYGSCLVQQGIVSVGDLSAFLLYAAYVGIAINGLSTFYSELQRSLGASVRLWQLLDLQVSPTASTSLPDAAVACPTSGVRTAEKEEEREVCLSTAGAHLQLSSVSFCYPSRPLDSVLRDISLTVQPGQVLALVGASGCGKSTIAWLLLRMYDPTSGQVKLDGVDLRRLCPGWLRRQIGFVSQEPTLFSYSIRENIAYGAADTSLVTEDMLWEAASKANADTFINSLSEGMDTVVGERGVMLSGGQKQRIAIARAIIKDPRLLILDEATSALDAESEFAVQKALETVMEKRTVVTIAHRLSTIRCADTVAVLHDGRVAELGSYDQLMTIPEGHFRRLVERQTFQS